MRFPCGTPQPRTSGWHARLVASTFLLTSSIDLRMTCCQITVYQELPDNNEVVVVW